MTKATCKKIVHDVWHAAETTKVSFSRNFSVDALEVPGYLEIKPGDVVLVTIEPADASAEGEGGG